MFFLITLISIDTDSNVSKLYDRYLDRYAHHCCGSHHLRTGCRYHGDVSLHLSRQTCQRTPASLPSARRRTHSCPPAAVNDFISRQPSPSFLSHYLLGAWPRSPQIRDGSLGRLAVMTRDTSSPPNPPPRPRPQYLLLRSAHLPV